MKQLLTEIASRCPGGKLPESYLVFDTETSGVNPTKDKILQYGFGVVKEGQLVDHFSILVNRPGLKIAPGAVAVHGISEEKMAAEGMDAEAAFNEVLSTFQAYRCAEQMFVGHNMIAFDAELFENESRHWGKEFRFGENEIFDTGMVVKAAQLGMYFDQRDSIRSWARKVSEVRARGVYWSLDRHCFSAFKLSKFGLDKEAAHDAGEDCQLTHFLVKRFKEKLEELIPEEEIPF